MLPALLISDDRAIQEVVEKVKGYCRSELFYTFYSLLGYICQVIIERMRFL